ncbi:ABC transporter permease subunit [Streptomyces sp. NBC_01260]|uniref:ABC transporter permease n=1 Tax=unclassified Streptomyces TaxID=2593676 RepID=UPI000F49A124|nr:MULTISPECIES: ABC transporter permease subunit [unclassified Streptomyces]MCX4768506.1 ABC transporter permease subunit [Streptomyces sp. NBC_01285]ROQ77370.1 carbohydrate ABC transporter membrane protein 1 (CUT1 family) [Streptomyces sp. CEV 2-1]RPK40172.1 putative multiple-sugar transport system permease YteP [Streptomyces sp. ADI92-24]
MKPRATVATDPARTADGASAPAGGSGSGDGDGRDDTDGSGGRTGGPRAISARRPRTAKNGPARNRPAGSGPRAGGITWRQRLRRDRTLVLMTLPAIALLLIFNYVPLLGNIVAFQDYDVYDLGITGSPFVGFDNFTRIFEDYRFWEVLINTLVIFVTQLVLFFPIPIAIALLLNTIMSARVRAWVQAVVYLPHFFSWVLVVTVFQQMFGGAGLVAQWLRDHGHEGFDLMTNPGFFKFLVSAQAVWKDAGWGVIVFLAALAAVNTDLYEAAAVDGAGRWRRMWHVTLPALRPVIALLLVLRVGSALNLDFEQILLQRDQVGAGASEILDTYIWWTGIKTGDFGYAAAAGIFKGLFSVAMVLGANKVAHMLGEQGVYSKK